MFWAGLGQVLGAPNLTSAPDVKLIIGNHQQQEWTFLLASSGYFPVGQPGGQAQPWGHHQSMEHARHPMSATTQGSHIIRLIGTPVEPRPAPPGDSHLPSQPQHPWAKMATWMALRSSLMFASKQSWRRSSDNSSIKYLGYLTMYLIWGELATYQGCKSTLKHDETIYVTCFFVATAWHVIGVIVILC